MQDLRGLSVASTNVGINNNYNLSRFVLVMDGTSSELFDAVETRSSKILIVRTCCCRRNKFSSNANCHARCKHFKEACFK